MSLPVSTLDALAALAADLSTSAITDLAHALDTSQAAMVRVADLHPTGSVPVGQHHSVERLVRAWQSQCPDQPGSALSTALLAMSYYDTRLRRELHVEPVWTGPRLGAAGLRRTEQVLLEMIGAAQCRHAAARHRLYRSLPGRVACEHAGHARLPSGA